MINSEILKQHIRILLSKNVFSDSVVQDLEAVLKVLDEKQDEEIMKDGGEES